MGVCVFKKLGKFVRSVLSPHIHIFWEHPLQSYRQNQVTFPDCTSSARKKGQKMPQKQPIFNLKRASLIMAVIVSELARVEPKIQNTFRQIKKLPNYYRNVSALRWKSSANPWCRWRFIFKTSFSTGNSQYILPRGFLAFIKGFHSILATGKNGLS